MPFLRRALPRRAERIADRIVFHSPDIRVSNNSAIPFSLNDGAMWAGRGISFTAAGGLGLDETVYGFRIQGAFAPALIFSENKPFEVFRSPDAGRSPFASPFHGPGLSMDYPLRFGQRYLVRLGLGHSSLSVDRFGVRLGLTGDDETWGPGIRNQLVLSANAPGIPRMYLRSARPVRTRMGRLDWRVAAGVLTESLFFDSLPDNDLRTFSGLLLEFRPAMDTNLTIGLARVVQAQTRTKYGGPIKHALDAVFRWEHVGADSGKTIFGSNIERTEQIASLFGRWVFPDAGVEAYGEYARIDLPRTISDLVLSPHYTGAFTVGVQWARETSPGRYYRFQAEGTSVEGTRVFPDRPYVEFYAGRATIHGYTNRGQVFGASIGPGASSQWLAADRLWRGSQIGVFLGRIRWENDALYRQAATNFFRHDVTVFRGIRGGLRTRYADFYGEAAMGMRYNYLFQWGGVNPGGCCTVDVRNYTLSINATPR
jgi:hypothetical protein